MEFIKVKDFKEMSMKAAEVIADRVKESEKPVLGLATGSTPEGLYKILVEKYKQGEIDFSKTVTFNLDEYIGLPDDDPQSYHYFMNENLFKHINIPAENTHVPSGMAEDVQQECRDYESLIQSTGKIDLQILGIGKNGHIGFNEPGTAFDSRTHIVDLDETTIQANARFFDSIDDVPTKAITMGIGTILESKEILMIISGEGKREAVTKLLQGEISKDFPASALHKHPNTTVIIDEAAWGDN
ncbi:glucosamine-6-phosphate deaminase [Oceanobacillus luteolus]|uniref:glucosamine-6-phosphate deaminase n=1 Tax=Oceanobacillus luteolus TaxID=1274358 RepID=UPI00203CB2B5|nr:glucosamine-6-phosphate deaminase [Oceanobacillus luteolus]MCM3741818.1 glucosamine-6-phosphate deaminase [Oceanobacillus luteolus]